MVGDFFGGAATEHDGELVTQLRTRHQKAFLSRQLQRVSQRPDRSWNDRDAMHRIGMLDRQRHQCVSGFVISDAFFLSRAHHSILLLDLRI